MAVPHRTWQRPKGLCTKDTAVHAVCSRERLCRLKCAGSLPLQQNTCRFPIRAVLTALALSVRCFGVSSLGSKKYCPADLYDKSPLKGSAVTLNRDVPTTKGLPSAMAAFPLGKDGLPQTSASWAGSGNPRLAPVFCRRKQRPCSSPGEAGNRRDTENLNK